MQFIVALFTMLETWKQPKCPSTEKWIKKMQYTHTVEYYSTNKENVIMPFAVTWMNLQVVILSEVGQILCDTAYVRNLKRSDVNKLIYKTETDPQTRG